MCLWVCRKIIKPPPPPPPPPIARQAGKLGPCQASQSTQGPKLPYRAPLERGVESRLVSCMLTLNSPRILIQKTDLRDFFRRTNPATGKSSPRLLGAYMRRAGKPHGKPTQLNYNCLGGSS